MAQTILCIKWGTRYGADYVNRLHSMVMRNTVRPTRLVCYTDDAEGVDPAVETHPIPAIDLPPRGHLKPWRKICLWRDDIPGVEGDVLFLDLDIVITGPLDDFFDYRPEARFIVAENWTQLGRGIGNTSAYRFRAREEPYIYERFVADPDGVIDEFNNSQIYISRTIRDLNFWPAEWCVSFKHTLLPRWPMNFFRTARLAPDARIVAFTGKPDPEDAVVGAWPEPKAWKRLYKHVRPTPWVAEHWR